MQKRHVTAKLIEMVNTKVDSRGISKASGPSSHFPSKVDTTKFLSNFLYASNQVPHLKNEQRSTIVDQSCATTERPQEALAISSPKIAHLRAQLARIIFGIISISNMKFSLLVMKGRSQFHWLYMYLFPRPNLPVVKFTGNFHFWHIACRPLSKIADLRPQT